jgi:hypothetical protein
MADEQELLEDGWQARDLRSGVAKVFQEAKRRNILGIRAAAVWAVIVLIYAVLDVLGVSAVAPAIWELVAGLSIMLMTALAMSRAPAPMLVTALVILADLIIVAYRLPEIFEKGETSDLAFTSVRITLAPAAMIFVLQGYLGALSIQAFKLGFSPGQDWRTRVNPFMLQATAVGACAGALGLGVAIWFGAINAGFSKPGAMMEMKTPQEIAAENQSASASSLLPFMTPAPPPAEQDYPENAKPIGTLEGLDAFTRREVEDAFDFGLKTDQAGCVDEGQGRQSRCRDERCVHWSRVFVRACLTKSKKDPKYCDGVPDPTMVEPGILWAQRLCAGRSFELCREILYAVQGHCHPPDQVAASKATREASEKVADAK